MAVLSNGDRANVWALVMTNRQFAADTIGIKKADLRAAVDALDSFLDTNAATINAAIPQPARGSLTAAQKALILQFIIEARYVRGS